MLSYAFETFATRQDFLDVSFRILQSTAQSRETTAQSRETTSQSRETALQIYEGSVRSITSCLEAMPIFSAGHLSSAHGGLTDGLQHSLQVVDHLSVEQVDNAMGVGGIVL